MIRQKYLSLIVAISLTGIQIVHAQTKIGGTAGAGDASAVLELQSTGNNQGFLPPRLTTAQRNAITSPATGLMIYNTDDQCPNVYKGSTNGWFNMCSGGGGFSFTNCASPTVTGSINLGSTVSGVTVTLNYVNNSGQTSALFGSNTVNGITLATTNGSSVATLATGTGSITLNVTGTPNAQGSVNVPVVIGSAACSVPLTIGGCADPGSTAGNTGCVSFTYRGASVIYTTVRPKDGHVWTQQNLGASRVATASNDASAYGDYFQYGRWDDGHQVSNSTLANVSTLSANNPTGLGTGKAIFYNSTAQWWVGGVSTDTWSGTTASATNGIDPCTALGSGWRLPTLTEWGTLLNSSNENFSSTSGAFASNLKIPAAGYRDWSSGTLGAQGSYPDLASSTASASAGNQRYVDGSPGSVSIGGNNTRGQGVSVRCLK